MRIQLKMKSYSQTKNVYTFVIFIHGLFSDVDNSNCVVSNGGVMYEQWTGKD
jgi:hypothetical protein